MGHARLRIMRILHASVAVSAVAGLIHGSHEYPKEFPFVPSEIATENQTDGARHVPMNRRVT